jgi:hypothetical protein
MRSSAEQGSLTFQSGLVYDVRNRDTVHVAARPPRPHLDHDVETVAPLILSITVVFLL